MSRKEDFCIKIKQSLTGRMLSKIPDTAVPKPHIRKILVEKNRLPDPDTRFTDLAIEQANDGTTTVYTVTPTFDEAGNLYGMKSTPIFVAAPGSNLKKVASIAERELHFRRSR